MIRAEQNAINVSILGGFKLLLVAGLGLFLFIEFGPMAEKKASDVDVTAASYPFTLPQMVKDGYVGENTQILNALSVWEFKLENNGSKEITGIEFDFPFSGSYYIRNCGVDLQGGLPKFSRNIKIETLAPGQVANLTLWVGEEINPEMERRIKVHSNEGMLKVDYPIMASGLVAWVERYKTPLTLALFILFILTIL
ncbi:MAG: hypothetical protein A2901_08525 [Elusimicrobia bacterium RIFCSPLOWO2_01_FULL_54_10]|nr:MAG: hypothetical protein A2901_08525 [Elusimicrobia bacterium RIFCSPLOWO2_01_FULL_54_10]